MAIEDTPGTTEYLTNAAHLLRLTAPETSAHLMSHRNQLLYHHKVSQSDIHLQRVCGGCGNIHIPPIDWKTVKHEPSKSRRKTNASGPRPRPSEKSAGPTASHRLIRCSKCDRETRIELPAPGPAIRSKIRVSTKVKKLVAAEAVKATANASSKKRAKNRKAGLQALLSGQQQQTSNPLSLASFMK